MNWPALLFLAMAACGSGKAVPAAAPPPAVGRVLLENQTGYAVEVVYLNGGGEIVRTRVESGEVREVSGGLLPGGTEWTFDLVLLLPAEQGYRVRRKARVLVDGEVRLRARLGEAQDPFSLEFGRPEG